MSRALAVFLSLMGVALGIDCVRAQYVSPFTPDSFKCSIDSTCGTPGSSATQNTAPYERDRSTVGNASLFRGFFVGMNEQQFIKAAVSKNKDYYLLLDQRNGAEYATEMQLKIYDKGKVFANTFGCDGTIAELCAEGQKIRVSDFIGKNIPEWSEKNIYVYKNPRELPRFVIETLKLHPSFFDAYGMSLDEFGRALLSKYSFVQNTLFPGHEKGELCGRVLCYVGLLPGGEKVKLYQLSVSDWTLLITKSDEGFSRKFQSIKPKFQ